MFWLGLRYVSSKICSLSNIINMNVDFHDGTSDQTVIAKETCPVSFLLGNGMYNLEIHDDSLQINCIKTKQSYPQSLSTLGKYIKLDDVLSLKCDVDEWMLDQLGQPLLEYSYFRSYFSSSWSPCYSLVIHYCVKLENHCRRLKTVKLKSSDYNVCREWCKKIDYKVKECIEKSGKPRPQNLLVIINPYAGNKGGKFVYKNLVSPLLEKAEIKVTAVFTEYRRHATEHLESADLSEYDGVVAVGGDGTFNEIVNGVLVNEQKRRGISLDSEGTDVAEQVTYSKPPFRLGLIPTGTGNALNYTTQGTNDVATSTLHIICGESHPFDVTSVHDKLGKFIRFTTLGLNYGFFSEALQRSETMRLLGPIRYKIASILLLMSFRYYPGEVSFLLSSTDNPVDVGSEKSTCRYPCLKCLKVSNISKDDTAIQNTFQVEKLGKPLHLMGLDDKHISDVNLNNDSLQMKTNDENDEKNEVGHDSSGFSSTKSKERNKWKVSSGPFTMITLLNTACRYDLSPNGFVPSAHLADGTNDLIVVHNITRRDFLNYSKACSGPGKHFDFPFVEVHRVKAIRFRVFPNKNLKSLSYHGKERKENTLVKSQASSKNTEDHCQSLNPGCWVSDGELLDSLDITAWIHKGLISIFARGLENH